MDTKTQTWRIPLADVDLGPEEEGAVLDVLRRGWLSMGGVTLQFEEEFAALVASPGAGTVHALAVTNCTAALHLAGLALGWGAGDEVIVPSLTFIATVNAVRYTGATPVFADITSESDFGLSAGDVAEKITPRTRAIIVVHYAGHACDMPAILALAEAHGLDVVEDVAHAPGARLNGRALGTWGRIGCFSFFSNKNMTTGEGGMVTTADGALAERVRLLRSHGMNSLTWDRHKGHASSYDVVAPGYNYRIDELRSAIGRVQLSKLAANNARRAEIDAYYVERLASLALPPGVPYAAPAEGSAPSYHLRPILLPDGADRPRFMSAMKAQGIQTSIHYPPAHTFSYYAGDGRDAGLPLTEAVGRREVTLPLYPRMSREDVDTVVDAVAVALDASLERRPLPTAA
jgi:dTDP-4-amino-4,6-dideoxygalactose transaminase